MKIHIAQSTASAPTELAAFDTCLQECGVANQNIIYLSSIIPPGSEIVFEPPVYEDNHFGNRLYCVMAQQREVRPNVQAWAGIGWVVDRKTGKGLFVEHEGHSEDEIKQDITKTLSDMMERRSETKWSKINMVVNGVTCVDKPVCAMVVAAYQSEGWGQ